MVVGNGDDFLPEGRRSFFFNQAYRMNWIWGDENREQNKCENGPKRFQHSPEKLGFIPNTVIEKAGGPFLF